MAATSLAFCKHACGDSSSRCWKDNQAVPPHQMDDSPALQSHGVSHILEGLAQPWGYLFHLAPRAVLRIAGLRLRHTRHPLL